MPAWRNRFSRLLCVVLATTLMVQSVSCGSILYPERIGQSRGPLDPKVVALDTAGLLLFLVPGAIAFAVDIYNGTIYLPETEYRAQSPDEVPPERWVSLKLGAEIDSEEELQKFLTRETGTSIELKDEDLQVIPLQRAPNVAPVQIPKSRGSRAPAKFSWKNLFRHRQASKKPRP